MKRLTRLEMVEDLKNELLKHEITVKEIWSVNQKENTKPNTVSRYDNHTTTYKLTDMITKKETFYVSFNLTEYINQLQGILIGLEIGLVRGVTK